MAEKSKSLILRLEPEKKAMIARASDITGRTMTDILLAPALRSATELVSPFDSVVDDVLRRGRIDEGLAAKFLSLLETSDPDAVDSRETPPLEALALRWRVMDGRRRLAIAGDPQRERRLSAIIKEAA